MKIDIDRLEYEELVDLNNRIVERLKVLDQLQAHAQMLEFSIGEKVMFEPNGREPLTGIISKYNRKTVTVITEDGQTWRISPQFLRKATSQQNEQGNVVSIHDSQSDRDA